MKNGLVLLLLMVALVAMTVPAGAMAPVVGPLPAVVVGGADTVDASTTDVRLLRYVNVFNLADPGVIDRKTNPDDVSKLKVWYKVNGTDASTLKASNATSLVTAMTAAEADALATAGTQPDGKQINTATDTWLSLIEDVVDGGRAHATSAAAATLDNGATSASLAAVEGKKTITLYAVDADVAPASAVGSGAFDVYSVITGTDGMSPRTSVASGTTRGTDRGEWQKANGPSTHTSYAAAGIGFVGKTNIEGTTTPYVYISWAMQLPVNLQVNPTGMIYEAKANVSASAINAFNTPGSRLFFIATLGCHAGGTQFMSNPANWGGVPTWIGVDSNIPKADANKEFRIYWAAPRDLTGMADSGQLASGSSDKRAYVVQFDLIQEQNADANNTLVMDGFTLDLIPRPVNIAPVRAWADGANGTKAMNDPVYGFMPENSGITNSYSPSNNTVGLSNFTLAMGSQNTAYGRVKPAQNATGIAALPTWQSGKLMRTTYVMQSSAASVATFRVLTMGMKLTPFAFSETATIDVFSMDQVRAQYTPTVANPIAAGTPKLSGSTVESYSYTHTAPAGCLLFPQFDIVQGNGAGTSNWHGWGKPGATVINSVAMEVLNP